MRERRAILINTGLQAGASTSNFLSRLNGFWFGVHRTGLKSGVNETSRY
jgi:hypothetical protein